MNLEYAEREAPPRFDLEIGGRRYPIENTSTTSESTDVRRKAIYDALWPLLALPTAVPSDVTSLVRTYDSDRQKIAAWRSQVRAMFAAIGNASIELRIDSSHSKSEMQRILSARQEVAKDKFSFPSAAADKVLSSELLLKPMADVKIQFVAELSARLNGIAIDLFATLDRLVNESAVGVIEWLNQSLCRFHYFRDVVVHDAKTTSRQLRDFIHDDLTGRLMTRVSEVQSHSGTNIYRLARHEHELMNAFSEPVRESSLVIPQAVQLVIDSIPNGCCRCRELYLETVFASELLSRICEPKSGRDRTRK